MAYQLFVDNTAICGKTYSYIIKGVNMYGIEGEASHAVNVLVDEDKYAPSVESISPGDSRINKTESIAVAATDNIAVCSVLLEYKADGADEWKAIGEEKTSG